MNEEILNMQIRKFLKKVGFSHNVRLSRPLDVVLRTIHLPEKISWKLLSSLKFLKLELKFP